jgi:hypothetical protein
MLIQGHLFMWGRPLRRDVSLDKSWGTGGGAAQAGRHRCAARRQGAHRPQASGRRWARRPSRRGGNRPGPGVCERACRSYDPHYGVDGNCPSETPDLVRIWPNEAAAGAAHEIARSFND